MFYKRLFAFCALLLSWGLVSINAVHSAPAANLWPHWQAHDPDSIIIIDHGDWDNILQHYVDAEHPSGINRFDYKGIQEKDRQALKNYIRKMQETSVSSLNRDQQKAYWINLYNALNVDLILDHYPVKSIRKIKLSPGIFNRGPWDAKLLKIEEQKVSLNDIEHRILRPIWDDNRVHYAVNCASLGCPNLQTRAFTPQNLELQLEKAASEYINHPRGVSFDRNKLIVSSIYFWFQEDFGNSEQGIVLHLQKYLTPEKVEKIKPLKKKMSHQYDWRLNE